MIQRIDFVTRFLVNIDKVKTRMQMKMKMTTINYPTSIDIKIKKVQSAKLQVCQMILEQRVNPNIIDY